MKICLLSKYAHLAASTRKRFLQYKPFLRDEGLSIQEQPLFDDRYLEQLYASKRRNRKHVASLYFRRLKWLLYQRDFDIIWLHCDLFPYLPGFLEHTIALPRKPIVFDYDDAIFHNYDQNASRIVRTTLGKKLYTTIKKANLVLAGNSYLAAYAATAGAPAIEIVPTVVDTDIYDAIPRLNAEATCRIGWIGTPGTWVDCVQPFLPIIRGALKNSGAEILAVGAGDAARTVPDVTVRDWAEMREVEDIRDMDVGIMPLPDTPWMRGKCGYKLIQYMACGLPVVASPVGVNAEIVEHGVNGFLAETERDWREALETLIADPDLRHRMGQAGREKVERHYSLQVQGPRVAQLLADFARGREP